jgi:hypothetical protein
MLLPFSPFAATSQCHCSAAPDGVSLALLVPLQHALVLQRLRFCIVFANRRPARSLGNSI